MFHTSLPPFASNLSINFLKFCSEVSWYEPLQHGNGDSARKSPALSENYIALPVEIFPVMELSFP